MDAKRFNQITDWLADGCPDKELKDGEPCNHPGCLSHISHPCEGCGRIGGKRVMDAKLTPEQAIETLRGTWVETLQPAIGTDGVKLLHDVAAFIESQTRDAELGRAAEKAIKSQCPFVGKYDFMSKTCNRCILKDYCRLRAGKGGE